MATESIDVLVEGGKATAAPPLGPALGPLGVNIGQVIAEINKKTADFKGMKVPVTVTVEREAKTFTIKVGTPPAAQLIKKEAGVELASGRPESEHVADLRIQQVIKIAKMKEDDLLGADTKARVKEIVGTCNSMGVMVEGKHARDTMRDIEAGKFDDAIKRGKTELTAEELKQLDEERKHLKEELEKKHAEEEKKAKDILASVGGEAQKARKLMEDAGISSTIMDKVAPKPKEAVDAKGGKGGKK